MVSNVPTRKHRDIFYEKNKQAPISEIWEPVILIYA